MFVLLPLPCFAFPIKNGISGINNERDGVQMLHFKHNKITTQCIQFAICIRLEMASIYVFSYLLFG